MTYADSIPMLGRSRNRQAVAPSPQQLLDAGEVILDSKGYRCKDCLPDAAIPVCFGHTPPSPDVS